MIIMLRMRIMINYHSGLGGRSSLPKRVGLTTFYGWISKTDDISHTQISRLMTSPTPHMH